MARLAICRAAARPHTLSRLLGKLAGPHTSDVPLEDIVDLILSMKAGAFVIEGVNPRHEHEWRVWETAKPPSGSVLIPGVIGRSRRASCVLHGWWGAKI